MKPKKKGIRGIIGILLLLFILSFGISLFFSEDLTINKGNVLVIPIKGIILADDTGGFGPDIASSSEIVADIEDAGENDDIIAVVFEINSPGGSAVASDEIGQAIKKLNKTTVSYIREVGASGGYWIASSTDRVYANRMSITGSIGVIASYLQFSGFLEKHNIEYERLVSGKYKDIGSPFKDLSDVERLIFQKSLDAIYDEFVKEVAENRGLEVKVVEKLATGQIFVGSEARELGLIDELGGKEDVKEFLEKDLNVTIEMFKYEKKQGLIEVLSQLFSGNSYQIGQGIGNALTDRSVERSVPVISILS